jgi:pimeloyl-ACP methyl ester carboxylesterase
VVADSPFARLRSPVRAAICKRGYPRAVSPLLAWSICTIASWQVRARGARDPIDVVDRIAPRPLLIVHGGADALIPVDNAYALYERAGQPKELWVVPGVEHARVPEAEPRAYAERVAAFFARWLLEPGGEPAAAARAGHGHDVGEGQLQEVDRR